MKIRVCSDLHLEMNDDFSIDMPEGDVLVLAGDVGYAIDYDNYAPFFEQCAEKYNKVYYVMGNHCYWYSTIEDARNIMKERLPRGVTLLDNRSEYYAEERVHFIGGTLFTDFNKGDGLTMADAGEYMNDYRLITDFTPEKALQEHTHTREWFERCIPTLKQGKVIVVTHHAPSQSSVKGRYTASRGAYGSDMNSFIQKHTEISHWIHGHVHESSDYMIGNTRVLCNPRGYEKMEMNDSFNIGFEFEV